MAKALGMGSVSFYKHPITPCIQSWATIEKLSMVVLFNKRRETALRGFDSCQDDSLVGVDSSSPTPRRR